MVAAAAAAVVAVAAAEADTVAADTAVAVVADSRLASLLASSSCWAPAAAAHSPLLLLPSTAASFAFAFAFAFVAFVSGTPQPTLPASHSQPSLARRQSCRISLPPLPNFPVSPVKSTGPVAAADALAPPTRSCLVVG